VALKVSGPATRPLLQSELDIARFSGWGGQLNTGPAQADPATPPPQGGGAAARGPGPAAGGGGPAQSEGGRLKVLTEGGIRAELLGRLDAAVRGKNIDIAMFYVSDRGVVESLLAASRRGVNVAPHAGIPTRTPSDTPRAEFQTNRWPVSWSPPVTAPSMCGGTGPTGSSSTRSW